MIKLKVSTKMFSLFYQMQGFLKKMFQTFYARNSVSSFHWSDSLLHFSVTPCSSVHCVLRLERLCLCSKKPSPSTRDCFWRTSLNHQTVTLASSEIINQVLAEPFKEETLTKSLLKNFWSPALTPYFDPHFSRWLSLELFDTRERFLLKKNWLYFYHGT